MAFLLYLGDTKMNLFSKHKFIFIFLFLISLYNKAQTYNFKNYNTEQGLPQSQVISIYQDLYIEYYTLPYVFITSAFL